MMRRLLVLGMLLAQGSMQAGTPTVHPGNQPGNKRTTALAGTTKEKVAELRSFVERVSYCEHLVHFSCRGMYGESVVPKVNEGNWTDEQIAQAKKATVDDFFQLGGPNPEMTPKLNLVSTYMAQQGDPNVDWARSLTHGAINAEKMRVKAIELKEQIDKSARDPIAVCSQKRAPEGVCPGIRNLAKILNLKDPITLKRFNAVGGAALTMGMNEASLFSFYVDVRMQADLDEVVLSKSKGPKEDELRLFLNVAMRMRNYINRGLIGNLKVGVDVLAKNPLLGVIQRAKKGKDVDVPDGVDEKIVEEVVCYVNDTEYAAYVDTLKENCGSFLAQDQLKRLLDRVADTRKAYLEPKLEKVVQSRDTPEPIFKTP